MLDAERSLQRLAVAPLGGCALTGPTYLMLCYTIVIPVLKSGFRAGFRLDSSR